MTFSRFLKNNSIFSRIAFSIVFVSSLLLGNKVSAQVIPCQFDEYLQQQLQEHPEMKKEMDWFNEYAKNYKMPAADKTRGTTSKIVIPVVVHVFHVGGDENISDAQIKSQIKVLNQDFQYKNKDTANLVPDFKPLKEGDVITCEVTKTACGNTTTVTSNSIIVTFQPSVTITTGDTNLCSGAGVLATFTAHSVNGGTSPVYQWKRNGVSVGSNSNTYTDSLWTNGDVVTCDLTSNSPCATGVVTSNAIKITVADSLGAALHLVQSPGAICVGTSIDLSVIPVTGGTAPQYSWFKNDTEIAGATDASYTVKKPDTSEIYYCRMISNAGCVTQDTVYSDTLSSSKTATILPWVTIEQTTPFLCANPQTVSFSATAVNGASYQWKVNGVKAGSTNPVSNVLNLSTAKIAASFDIEFRLASIDPDGNCTNGIVRYYTPLTNSADDAIKKLSVWPSDKYLNIWVVKNIKTIRNEWGGIILGYATFPNPGMSLFSNDGVIIKSDYFGNIGTSDSTSKMGRVATHEIGHWLSLIHTFQDGCNGGDLVQDTPPANDANFGCKIGVNTCTNDNPDFPDMVQNYMDYSDGACQNLFTEGQKTRAMAALNAYRNILFSRDNLIATGTDDDAVAGTCAPKSAFNAAVSTACEGNTVSFNDFSYNGAVTSWSWSFPGGEPSTSTAQFPVVKYSTAGTYDVTLTVSNAVGTSTVTKTNYITVLPATSGINGVAQDFESNNFPYNWTLETTSSTNWERTTKVKSQGNACMMFANNLGETDSKVSFVSPAINLRESPTKMFSFTYAYAPRAMQTGTTLDRLTVFVSVDCGKTWVSAWSRNGTLLNTLTGVPTTIVNYYPVYANEWKTIEVPLLTWSTRTNVLIKLEFSSKGGHNIFIDNINLGYPTGVEGVKETQTAAMDVFPNPATNSATVSYWITNSEKVEMNMFDITGRKVLQLVNETVAPGAHDVYLDAEKMKNLTGGTYILEMKTSGQIITRKFIKM